MNSQFIKNEPYIISQEWQEIGLRNFVHMLFDARAFECDAF
jgi:hypothetical protein